MSAVDKVTKMLLDSVTDIAAVSAPGRLGEGSDDSTIDIDQPSVEDKTPFTDLVSDIEAADESIAVAVTVADPDSDIVTADES